MATFLRLVLPNSSTFSLFGYCLKASFFSLNSATKLEEGFNINLIDCRWFYMMEKVLESRGKVFSNPLSVMRPSITLPNFKFKIVLQALCKTSFRAPVTRCFQHILPHNSYGPIEQKFWRKLYQKVVVDFLDPEQMVSCYKPVNIDRSWPRGKYCWYYQFWVNTSFGQYIDIVFHVLSNQAYCRSTEMRPLSLPASIPRILWSLKVVRSPLNNFLSFLITKVRGIWAYNFWDQF